MVTFTEEILKGKLHFLCSDTYSYFTATYSEHKAKIYKMNSSPVLVVRHSPHTRLTNMATATTLMPEIQPRTDKSYNIHRMDRAKTWLIVAHQGWMV